MALFGIARETDRLVRFLIHPSLVKMPFLADFMRKQGGVMACRDNADRLLGRGELLGVYPEGIGGAFSYYREAYTLRTDFGRDEYVKAALRNGVPIVPFVTVGSAEIFPVIAKINWNWWKRFTWWPCFPIAPPFPVAPIPLPSKWHTRFLEAIPVHEQYGPEAARDRHVVSQISADIRQRMQAAIDDMLARRRHVFFGTLAGTPSG
jgi:1-acyl-sn-glycerol-3-phosphate acyltransferase